MHNAYLYIEDLKFPVKYLKYNFRQFTGTNSKPNTRVFGGEFSFTFDIDDKKAIHLIDWMLSSIMQKNGYIEIMDFNQTNIAFKLEFANAYATSQLFHYDAYSNLPLQSNITVTAGALRFNKDPMSTYKQTWEKGDPFVNDNTTPINEIEEENDEKEKEPFKIEFKAKNNDLKNGNFGFDSIPDKKIVESNYNKLKEEYKPLSEKILGDEYIPSWLSLREDQTVELELDWTKKGRAENYETISFQEHQDFTFEPINLKKAKTVKITCKNHNETPAQLLIKADDELIVGALNIFYSKPKTIDLEWCFAEIRGDEKDKKVLLSKIKKMDLEKHLKKGLNPALIDVNITNNEATIVDISGYYEGLKKHKFIKEHVDDRIGSYIERSKKATVLSYLNHSHKEDTSKITVYFINQKCINETDITEDSQFKATGGVSPTGTGIAYMVLDPEGNMSPGNIVHEILHALGAHHTFKEDEHKSKLEHELKIGKTDNYMDYHNTKKHTYKWQWKQLHKYPKLK